MARKLSSVQEVMLRSTDYLRRIVVPAGRQGGVTMSYLCLIATVFMWKTTFGASQWRKSTPAGGVRSVEKKYDWRAPNRRKCQPGAPYRVLLQTSVKDAGKVSQRG